MNATISHPCCREWHRQECCCLRTHKNCFLRSVVKRSAGHQWLRHEEALSVNVRNHWFCCFGGKKGSKVSLVACSFCAPWPLWQFASVSASRTKDHDCHPGGAEIGLDKSCACVLFTCVDVSQSLRGPTECFVLGTPVVATPSTRVSLACSLIRPRATTSCQPSMRK